MAIALYRRYRPQSFAEVIGQDHVTDPLSRALNSGRVGHAYLFSGPRGCGKTTSARILARCLNCTEGPTATPCGVCDSCVDLGRNGSGSLDVVEIDAASHGGVDDARELRERAAFAPVRDRFKVFIIDEAHMVTSAGFNALLKLVEEPPEHVKFIFATTEPDKVIGTIRSRTHHYPFRLIPGQILLPYLEEICAQEQVKVADGVLSLAVRAGGGSARDTLSVLDQLIAGSDERGVELQLATNLLGFTDAELLHRVLEALIQQDAAALFTVIDEVIASGHEPRRFVEDLLERMRDLIVLIAAPAQVDQLLPDLTVEQRNILLQQGQQIAPQTLTAAAQTISETLNSMVGATSPRLHLELLAAKLLLGSVGGTSGNAGSSQAPAGTGFGASSAARDAVPAQNNASAPGSAPAKAGGLSPRERARLIVQEQVAADSAPQPAVTTQVTKTPEPPTPAPQAPVAPAPHTSTPPAPTTPQTDTTPAEVAQPEPEKEVAEAQAPATPAPSTASSADISQIQAKWPQLMEALQNIRRASWALIAQNAGVQSFDGKLLVLRFSSEGLVAAFYRRDTPLLMAQAVQMVLGLEVRVEATASDSPNFKAQAPQSTPAQPATPVQHSNPAATPVQPPALEPTPPVQSPVQPPATQPSATAAAAWDPVPEPDFETEPAYEPPPWEQKTWEQNQAPETESLPDQPPAGKPRTAGQKELVAAMQKAWPGLQVQEFAAPQPAVQAPVANQEVASAAPPSPAPTPPAPEPEFDDPYDGASMDDPESTDSPPTQNFGTKLVEELLGGEVLEVRQEG